MYFIALTPDARSNQTRTITPEYSQAVGQFYEDFSQTTDEEVRELVARAAQRS